MGALHADTILDELNSLWASLGGAVRACSLTLIVFAEESDDAAAIGETLAELMREHPHRAVVVRIQPVSAPYLEHQVRSQCWMPLGRQEQVCCEQIEITASQASLADVVPVLAALRAPDLPLVLWYRSASVFNQTALAPGGFRPDKVIVDSDAAEPADMLPRLAGSGFPVADLAWTRLTRWRAIVAQLFESPRALELLPRVREVRVLYSGGRLPSQALYLAGWILGALGREVSCRFDEAEGEPGGIQGIELPAGEAGLVSVKLSGGAVVTTVDGIRNCAGLPVRSDAELLAEELAIAVPDSVFREALRHAARLAVRP